MLSQTIELTEEEISNLVNKFSPLKSRVRILARDSNLSSITTFIQNPKKTIIALDWDQTVTYIKDKHLGPKAVKSIRGGDHSKNALQKCFDEGAELIVITAQEPTAGIMKNLRAEVVKLELSKIFHVEELDRIAVLNFLRQMPPNPELDLDSLTQKLAILLILFSPRLPADLARLSDPSRIIINEERTRVTYKLQIMDNTNPAYLEWGGNQVINARKEKVKNDKGEEQDQVISDDYTCPIRTWWEYIEKTKGYRQINENGQHKVERLFLKKITTEAGDNWVAMDDLEMINSVRTILERANIPEGQIKLVLEDPLKITEGEGGQVARLGHLFASRYNKPEAMEQFLKIHPERTDLIFVDDNSDNAWNMFVHFAQKEIAAGSEPFRPITSFWYACPMGGKDERYSDSYRTSLLRTYDTYGEIKSSDILNDPLKPSYPEYIRLEEKYQDGNNDKLIPKVLQVLEIISSLGFPDTLKRAYLLSLLLKTDEDMKNFWSTLSNNSTISDPKIIFLALEYNHTSMKLSQICPTLDQIRISAILEVNVILFAEKLVCKNDFNLDNPNNYFIQWANELGLTSSKLKDYLNK